MKRRQFILSLTAVLGVSACMQTGTVMQTGSTYQAPADKGLVVFYRPASFAGGAIRFNVQHADGPVGQLTSGAVLQKTLSPGDHRFWAQSISQDAITVRAEAGQTLYVRGDVRMGIYAGRPQFTQVSEAQARKEMAR